VEIQILNGTAKTIEAQRTHYFAKRQRYQIEFIQGREILTLEQRAQLIELCCAGIRVDGRLIAGARVPLYLLY
jgi:hypothetical protein